MLEIPHPQYFEGILQLRDCKPELKKWVYDAVARDKKSLITREKKVRGGVDLYFSSQRYLRALGKKINSRFVGEFKQTRTLHTVSKTGRELYRVTVLFRQSSFNIGDKIKLRGEEYKILTYDNQVRVKNLETGKKKGVKKKELKLAKKI